MLGKVVTFANFKGGTGKTTNASLISYTLAKKGFKTLLIDMDPQGNATSLMLKTYLAKNDEQLEYERTIMGAIIDKNLRGVILHIDDNLDIIPAYRDFARYSEFLEDIIPTAKRAERPKYFKALLEEIRSDYDFILLDIPPTVSAISDSALASTDYAIIIMQTHERSLVGARSFIDEMMSIAEKYNPDLDLLGVLPVILKQNAVVDKEVMSKARELFGEENMFDLVIPYMERLKTWDFTGITIDRDVHDKRAFSLYEELTDEFLKRIEEIENE